MVQIRRAKIGDEKALARIQTESWRAAFAGIVPAELLAQCTSLERAERMYARLLSERRGNGYILELDGAGARYVRHAVPGRAEHRLLPHQLRPLR